MYQHFKTRDELIPTFPIDGFVTLTAGINPIGQSPTATAWKILPGPTSTSAQRARAYMERWSPTPLGCALL
ncbi:MAG TPA: hypothetical protein H9884_03300 [Candidatus Yaniella excrementigallinarum]|nr:hypothetical protein [Candidatus Yaniella excrementigallinarum]